MPLGRVDARNHPVHRRRGGADDVSQVTPTLARLSPTPTTTYFPLTDNDSSPSEVAEPEEREA